MRTRSWVLIALTLGLLTSALPVLWARAAEDHQSSQTELLELQDHVTRLEDRVYELEREREQQRQLLLQRERELALQRRREREREREQLARELAEQTPPPAEEPERAAPSLAKADAPPQERGELPALLTDALK